METTDKPDLQNLYRLMYKIRLFEEKTARLWHEGKISGELHLGTGEEAIMAGIIPQLQEDDALALDHRGTAAMLLRGVDPVALIRELVGHPGGLSGGKGGHMHLFSRSHLAASSGIVGAAGPLAVGFALAATRIRPGNVAVAFFGDGAMNQGMLLESFNLAKAWNLPVLFVCKDSEWAITTVSAEVTGGAIGERARGFGLPVAEIDGTDVEEVWETAEKYLSEARKGNGPAFIRATCVHLEGHFLGYPLLRISRHPVAEMAKISRPFLKSFFHPKGADLRSRLKSLKTFKATLQKATDEKEAKARDPVRKLRTQLLEQHVEVRIIEQEVQKEIEDLLHRALPDE